MTQTSSIRCQQAASRTRQSRAVLKRLLRRPKVSRAQVYGHGMTRIAVFLIAFVAVCVDASSSNTIAEVNTTMPNGEVSTDGVPRHIVKFKNDKLTLTLKADVMKCFQMAEKHTDVWFGVMTVNGAAVASGDFNGKVDAIYVWPDFSSVDGGADGENGSTNAARKIAVSLSDSTGNVLETIGHEVSTENPAEVVKVQIGANGIKIGDKTVERKFYPFKVNQDSYYVISLWRTQPEGCEVTLTHDGENVPEQQKKQR